MLPLTPFFAGRRILSHAFSSQWALDAERAVATRLNEDFRRFGIEAKVDLLALSSGRHRMVMLDDVGLPHKTVYEREQANARKAGEPSRTKSDAVWDQLNTLAETHQLRIGLVFLLKEIRQLEVQERENPADAERLALLREQERKTRQELEKRAESVKLLETLEKEYDSLMEEADGPLMALKKRFMTDAPKDLDAYVRSHATQEELVTAARLQEYVTRMQAIRQREASSGPSPFHRMQRISGRKKLPWPD